jgi:hypothetical protein
MLSPLTPLSPLLFVWGFDLAYVCVCVCVCARAWVCGNDAVSFNYLRGSKSYLLVAVLCVRVCA